MFDLEQAIADWRGQMLAAGITSSVLLDGLESHVREEVGQQLQSGANARRAFETATQKIGQVGLLKKEFTKASGSTHERLKRYLLALSGVPNSQLATSMNMNISNIEPRWATYARAGTFLFPAAFLWLFTVVFVLPKANEICQGAGTTVYDLDHAPAVFKASAAIGQAMIFLTSHGLLAGGVVFLTLVSLERYFSRWPRYRRAVLGTGVFLFNAVVLVSLTLMIVSVLVAVPGLVQHIRMQH